MAFFDGTWGRRKFLSWCEGQDFERMSIEERNYLLDSYDIYLDQLIFEGAM